MIRNKLLSKYQDMPVQVRASFWFIICGFLQRGISTLTTPIFTRLLSTSEYGDYNTFSSWLEIITVFATLRLGFGVFMQGCVKFEDDRKRFSASLLSLATIWLATFFIIYIVFRDFWNRLFVLSTFEMLCMFVMMLSTIAFNFWSVLKRVDFDYKPLVKVTLLVSLLKPILGISSILVFPDNKVEARIASLAVVELISYGGLFISIIKGTDRFIDHTYWKYALNYNLPLIPHFLSQTVLNHSDRIMIRSMVGSDAAGIYSLAYSISTIMAMINTSIQNTLNPWIYKQIRAKEFQKIAKVSYLVLLTVALADFTLICVAPEVVWIFAPGKYQEAVYAIPPVTMGSFFLFMYCLFADFELYEAKTVYMMTASLTGAVMNVILNYIFIRIYGYIAAAYTTLICYIVYSTLHYFFMRHICKKRYGNVKVYNMKIILGISLTFCALGFLMMYLYPLIIVRYGLIVLALISLLVLKNKIIGILKPVFEELKGK